MALLQEFKEFAVKGNVVDMAVGIVIGAGFGKIVSSLVQDILTPPLGLVLGGVDFTQLAVTLNNPIANAHAVTINYGKFLQTVFDFIIVAFAMFVLVKGINKLRRRHEEKAEAAPAPISNQEKLLAEIRDLLKASRNP